MKRASSGRVGLQLPGVLKPRNEDLTPKNRQSGSYAARKSFIPKMGQIGSGKRATTRMGRSSSENLPRNSLALSRFTPTRVNTPSWAPQSANRLSTDSAARNSGIGSASTRKDSRYVFDPSYKTYCIDKILDFLRNNSNHRIVCQRRSLLTPTTKVFTEIFTFIYQFLDPNYTLPTRFEEEIPKLLKLLHCPIQLTKSSFVTVGSPHTWPSILAAMAFLLDVVHLDGLMNDSPATLSDLEDEDDEPSSRLNVCIDLFKCTDEDEINACIEAYSENLRAEGGVTDKGMTELEEEIEQTERALESLPKTEEELKHLEQCSVQYSEDIVKLHDYLQNLRNAIENKTAMENDEKEIIEKLNAELRKIQETVESLKRFQIQQGYNRTDLLHLKNHAEEAGREIEHQEHLGKELCSQGWNMELEMSKVQSSLRNTLVKFNDLLEKLGVKADFSDMDIDMGSEDLHVHYAAIMDRLMTHKKAAKKATSQAQNKMWEADQDLERAKGTCQEKSIEDKKLETKMRHKEEEYEVMREEMAREEQLRLEENEVLHQRIMEARKAHTNATFHMQQQQEILNEKTLELESCKRRQEMRLCGGTRYQMKVYEETLQSVEAENVMIAQFAQTIGGECDQFMAWFDSQLNKD